MPRLLSDAPCSVTFYDKISDSKITLFYRLPTTEERITYINSYISRKGKNVEVSLGENRVDRGMDILTGFKEGNFLKADNLPLSSDPESKNYDPGWKNTVRKYGADLVSALAMHVFEGSAVVTEPDPT
jgi:hypothetical protein